MRAFLQRWQFHELPHCILRAYTMKIIALEYWEPSRNVITHSNINITGITGFCNNTCMSWIILMTVCHAREKFFYTNGITLEMTFLPKLHYIFLYSSHSNRYFHLAYHENMIIPYTSHLFWITIERCHWRLHYNSNDITDNV